MRRAGGGQGPSDGTIADPSPFGDASKLYISDMTDARALQNGGEQTLKFFELINKK